MTRDEAAQYLQADRMRHESDGWEVRHPSDEDPPRVVMTRGSSTRRVWLKRHTAEQAPIDDEPDIRRLLARGFEYPRSLAPATE
jgi:hypothetical protein